MLFAMKASRGVLLAGLLQAIAALDDEPPCRARAWVRAPDLEPGQVIQGDVRVKLDGVCDSVSSYSLGLRFAERSWVKTRREGAKLPEIPTPLAREIPLPTGISDDTVFDSDMFSWSWRWNTPEVDASTWETYENEMKDPSLWLVREEERIGFETKYILRNGERLSHDAVDSFAVLVPSTNYPPAFDQTLSSSIGGEADIADGEHIYTYFVDVTFANGTQMQIPAGYTSFNPATPPELSLVPEKVNISSTRRSWGNQASDTEEPTPRDEFTLEVTFPNGRHLEQGSIHNITVISHQLGPGLQRPLSIDYVDLRAHQKLRWAASLATDNETAETLIHGGSLYEYQLQPTADDEFVARRRYSWESGFELPKFSQEGIIENGTAFATKSVIVGFEVPPFYPTFDMYYQASEVELILDLAVRNVSSEATNLNPFSSDAPVGEEEEEDEYDWTPVLQGDVTYPIADMEQDTYPIADMEQIRIPVFVHGKSEPEVRGAREPTHYLSPEARAPVFVEPSSVAEIIRKTVEDRDSLAPLAQARFTTPADGNVVKHRYYGTWGKKVAGSFYVGNTWLRKVVNGNRKELQGESDKLIVQA